MGLYASDHPDVPGMKGLHLFHFVLSNCSQRVRIVLEEKSLEWTSHHLDLPGNEHITSDYRRINPKGLVPTLVHDGQVVIESNDIIGYLDEHFPDPPLRPSDTRARETLQGHLDASSEFQTTIKVLSHELLFRPFRKVGQDELALYKARSPDAELVEFLRDYAENEEAWSTRVDRAQAQLTKSLGALDSALSHAPWLSGDAYGIADVSWVVNANRLEQAGVDTAAWPHYRDWAGRAMARPAFDRAVVSYRP